MKNLKMKSARVVKDLTQQGLADAIGVSRQIISAIEKVIIATINLCIAIVQKLWTTLDQLFGNHRGLVCTALGLFRDEFTVLHLIK